MIIAAGLKQLLDRCKLEYKALAHKRVTTLEAAASLLNINLANVITTQVLGDKQGLILVALPLNRQLDLNLCNSVFRRNFQLLPAIETNRLFNDCEAGSWPAVGQPYKLEIVLDQSIRFLEQIYFASGSHTSLINMSSVDYLVLNARAKILPITSELTADNHPLQTNSEVTHAPAGFVFPNLPPVALQILQLSMGDEQATHKLAALVAQDQLMQEHIMFYSQLPYIQAKLQADSNHKASANVEQVVDHILGFDMVSHIALGVAAGRALNQERVADREDFWRHALYAASYAEAITQKVAAELELDPAISYLAGLFHNFGLLLISQLFPPEYALLKKWLLQNPKVSISVLEKRLLGMGQALDLIRGGHAQLGEWLLRSWHMPESICVITKEHHSITYKGKYANYVRIIQLTNQLLREQGIGDGVLGSYEPLLEALGLSMLQVDQCLEPVKLAASSLDNMARTLTKS